MRAIPDPGFADDDGAASPAVVEALQEVAAGAPLEVAVAALAGSRLLVPVVPVASAGPGGRQECRTRARRWPRSC